MIARSRFVSAVTTVLAACLGVGAAQAQDDPETAEFYAGPPEIVLYDFPNFAGQSLTLNADAENLTRQGFNDRTSSIRVVSGNWEVCYDANYRSQCIAVTSDEPTLGRADNQISSVRVLRGSGGGGVGGGRDSSLTLYAGPNFTGQSVTLDSAVANFTTIRFNDRARSARFDGRGSWRVCQHANYGGNCSEITGDVRDLAVIRLAGEISSAAPSGRGPGGPGRPGNDYAPREGVRLFDGRGFSGQRFDAQTAVTDLSRTGFNDRTESIAIAPGEVWEFCVDANFRSQCRTFSESIADLGAYRMDNTISSLRRVGGGGYPGGPGGPGFPGGPGGPGGGYRGPIDGAVEGIGAAFFPVPEVNGYAIDRCLGSRGRDCDTAAADYVCQEAGYRQAAYFTVDRGRRYRTLHIGENSICRTGQCEAILNLTCVNE